MMSDDRELKCCSRRSPYAFFGSILTIIFALTPMVEAMGQSAPVIYPSKGQSAEQQAQDRGACQAWAQQQTGFNPMAGQPAANAAPAQGGQMVGGAARGAALGAVGGAIGGDAGKGASIGAGVGAARGLMRKQQANRANEQAQQQANAQHNQQLGQFNKAFATCMQGKGYAVN